MTLESSLTTSDKFKHANDLTSALMREAYVFGGALKNSVTKVCSDPKSLLQFGEAAITGAALTLIQHKCKPLNIGLEMIGLSGIAATKSSDLESLTKISNVWSRTWESARSLESDKAAIQKLTDDVVVFGVFAAGGIVAPTARALSLRANWRAAKDIPFYRTPAVPPNQNMIDVFEQKQGADDGQLLWLTVN